MKRHYPIAAVVLLSTLAVAGAVAGPAAATNATLQQATNASVAFTDQPVGENDSVTVESATLPEGGFVVIYNASGGVVGTSDALDAGTQENLTVELAPPPARSGVFIAEVHRDNDSDGSFNATTDAAYNSSGGNAVSATAYLTVESGATTTAMEETTSMDEMTSADETTSMGEDTAAEGTSEEPAGETTADGTETTGPGFTLVGALVALVAAALLARRT